MAEMIHAMHNASASEIWLQCSLYYHFKKDAYAKDEVVWDTAGKAAERGKIQHDIAEHALPLCLEGVEIPDAVGIAVRKVRRKVSPDEVENVRIAMGATLALITEGMHIEVERAVPLSHEPGSNGYIDVAGYAEKYILVLDYKFGQMAVSPNSSQLKLYAANLITLLREESNLGSRTHARLAIVQPQLHTEAIVRTYTVEELTAFQHHVEAVVLNQTEGHDRRGAGSLKTCTWCPQRKRGCYHRTNLVGSMLRDLDRKSVV